MRINAKKVPQDSLRHRSDLQRALWLLNGSIFSTTVNAERLIVAQRSNAARLVAASAANPSALEKSVAPEAV